MRKQRIKIPKGILWLPTYRSVGDEKVIASLHCSVQDALGSAPLALRGFRCRGISGELGRVLAPQKQGFWKVLRRGKCVGYVTLEEKNKIETR